MCTRNRAATAAGSDAVAAEPVAPAEASSFTYAYPPFWPEQPAMWFVQIEAQFALHGITADNIKFFHIISQLEPKYALEVQELFSNQPDKDKYEMLKKELIRRSSASQSQRVLQLLETEEIGDRSPSQLLRHMKNLVGTIVPEDCLRTLWARRLPAMTRAAVTVRPDLPLMELAEIADRIQENLA